MSNIDDLMENNKKLVYHIFSKEINKSDIILRYKEDIIEEGFIGLWEAIKNYNKDSNIKFANYACIVIYRRMLLEIRKIESNANGVVSLQDKIDDNFTIEDTVCDKVNYEDKICNKIYNKEILNSKTLTDEQKKVCDLYLQGYTQTDISKIIKKSRQRVSVILYNASNRIKITKSFDKDNK